MEAISGIVEVVIPTAAETDVRKAIAIVTIIIAIEGIIRVASISTRISAAIAIYIAVVIVTAGTIDAAPEAYQCCAQQCRFD
jgi:hypothetical protein